MAKIKSKMEKQKKLVCELIYSKNYIPMKAKEIAALLDLSKAKRKDLQEILLELMAEDKITMNKKGQFRKVKTARSEKKKGVTKTGLFISHPNGFGFVELEDQEEDIFIPRDNVGMALHHDTVEIQLFPHVSGKRQEGKIIKVLSHGIEEIVGTFQECKNFGFVRPDNQRLLKDIFIPIEHCNDAKNGDKVIVKLVKYGEKNQKPEGRVTEILGNEKDAGVDVLSIAKGYDLPMEFPHKVMDQADRIKQHLIEGDFYGREDIRDWTVVTIDGEDAKDLDDGISLTKEDDHYMLGVHIADVSNYVQYKSALDQEALKRGTSVYLVDRVIPMLPPRLSNGICSLNQGEDRLALSCIMEIDAKGRIVDHRIAETVICVDRRMSYTNVKKILEKEDEEILKEYEPFIPMFETMAELSAIIRKNRKNRGSIDFNFPESKILLDKAGKPVDIYPYEHNIATDIIEDFMLLANETVAEEFCEREIPFVYRTHENPDPEKMEATLLFVRNQGIDVKKNKAEISPKEIQKIMEQISGSPKEALISRVLLRSMKQARYTTDCNGHFGLAAKYYCHFTSPIRRYPDLQIHRIIKDTLRNRMTEKKIEQYKDILDDVAKQSSAMERRAEEVERETNKLKKAEYMSYHIGEVFDGIISGVTGWGIYVELPNTVEGLIPVSTMRNDYYIYDEANHQLVGEASKKVFSLGEKITVRVEDADCINKTVDFSLMEDTTEEV